MVDARQLNDPSGEVTLTSGEHLRALANSQRLRIIGLLRDRPSTMAELGDALGLGKGSVSYHLRTLERAGIAQQTEARQVRGGAQQVWTLSASSIAVELPGDDPTARSAVVRIVASQMEAGTDQRLFISHVRLTDEARDVAIAILDEALARVRDLRSDEGRVVTFASLAFGERLVSDRIADGVPE